MANDQMQSIILTRVQGLLDEHKDAASKANADISGLLDSAIREDSDYAKVTELRDKYVKALEALRDKVRPTLDIPSESDQENAKRDMVEIKKKMRDLYKAIPTILEMDITELELPSEFTEIAGTKAKSSTGNASGIRRPRIDSATISDSSDNSAVNSWADKVTVTKIAEFLGVENADLMVHIPENFKDEEKVEFTFSPDKGNFSGRHLDIVLIPRK